MKTPPKEKITAPHNLHRLITAALGGDADAALTALENACAVACEPSDILQAPGAEDVLEPAERRELQEHLLVAEEGHVRQAAAAAQAYTKQQRQRATRMSELAEPPASEASATAPVPAPEQRATEQRATHPAHWQAAGLEEGLRGGAFIQDFMPPGFRVSTDLLQGRWRASCRNGFNDGKSFSWSSRGHQEAAELLLRWAWDRRAAHLGERSGAHICPHLGLFTQLAEGS